MNISKTTHLHLLGLHTELKITKELLKQTLYLCNMSPEDKTHDYSRGKSEYKMKASWNYDSVRERARNSSLETIVRWFTVWECSYKSGVEPTPPPPTTDCTTTYATAPSLTYRTSRTTPIIPINPPLETTVVYYGTIISWLHFKRCLVFFSFLFCPSQLFIYNCAMNSSTK